MTQGLRGLYGVGAAEFAKRAGGARWVGALSDLAWCTGDARFGTGEGAMTDLPTGTVTFVFTDLEGSTRLWAQQPDEMPDALARHDAILRDVVEAHGGHVVKTTGDGVHAAFATAHDAVTAAMDAQRRLMGEDWPVAGPFRVRMGIHTGKSRAARRRLFRHVGESGGADRRGGARRSDTRLASDGTVGARRSTRGCRVC